MPQAEQQTRPQPRAGIMDIEAYVPGKSAAPAGVTKVYKLSSNENPLGASPKAIEAVRDVAAKLEFYPDGSATRLREAIAEVHGLNPANIVCSNGSDEMHRPARPDLPVTGRRGAFSPSMASWSTRSTSRLQALFPSRSRKPTSAPMSTRSSPR